MIDAGSVVCVARTGKGRFSTVYYSREKRSDAPCAVKVITLSAAQGGNKTSYSKCLKEVGLLRNLAHPNIIKYSDSFLEEDVLFIVLEWAAGGDLKNLISKIRREQTQLEEHTVWSYFSQCCEAVHHMHGQRIIHRCASGVWFSPEPTHPRCGRAQCRGRMRRSAITRGRVICGHAQRFRNDVADRPF